MLSDEIQQAIVRSIESSGGELPMDLTVTRAASRLENVSRGEVQMVTVQMLTAGRLELVDGKRLRLTLE